MTDIVVANTEAPLFEVDIGRESRKLSPRSVEELEQWLQRERGFWKWLRDAQSDDAQVDAIFNLFFNHEKSIVRTVQAAREAPTEEQRAAHLTSLKGLLSQRYSGNLAITSESPIAQYVAGLVEHDKVVAAHALWALLGHDPRPTNRPGRAFRGQVLATLYSIGMRGTPEAVDSAWKELGTRIRDEHEDLRKSAGRLQDDFTKLTDDVRVLHENQRRLFDERQAKRDADFAAQAAASMETLKNIAETYDKKLALQSAVTYLEGKALHHDSRARRVRRWALGVGGAFAALAVSVTFLVFKSGDPPLAQTAVAVLAATLMFWLLRVLVRMFLSNEHLATDMRHRATLMQTYLSLLREGGGLKEDDRGLIVNLLFRPTSDGLVRDDAAPPGIWDLLTRGGR